MPSSRTHTSQFLAQDSSLFHVTPITHLFFSAWLLKAFGYAIPSHSVCCSLIKLPKATHLALCSDIMAPTACHSHAFKVFSARWTYASYLSYLPLPSWAHLALPPNRSAVPVQVHVLSHFWASAHNAPVTWDALPHLHVSPCSALACPAPIHRSSQKYLGPLIDTRTKNNIIFKYWLLLCLLYLYRPFENVHFM